MNRGRFVITITLWAVLLVVLNGVVVAYAWQRMHPPANLPEFFSVPHFSLTDQEGRTVSDESLRGKIWIADFIFTGCAGSCPMMSSKMAGLQSQIKDPSVQLVSFTVDPKNDTPAVLKGYAARYGAHSDRWRFLTGTEQQMQDVALGMKIDDGKSSKAALPLDHSTLFLLVDAQGMVRGIYENKEVAPEKGVKQLAKDAAALAEGRAR